MAPCCTILFAVLAFAADPPALPRPTEEQRTGWTQRAESLSQTCRRLRVNQPGAPVADVDVFAKAVEWTLRHDEFNKPNSLKAIDEVLRLGEQRIDFLAAGKTPWSGRSAATTVFGYESALDGSVQPFAVTLPPTFDPTSRQPWPLHVVLHGRDDKLTEVNFITAHEGKPLKDNRNWIQLDVFGRTNNAYRWAGEVDVFEAMAAVKRRFPIDDRRITLWGFSMGGAGAWHLGLHYPDQWSSVGAGAGFCDTVKYLNLKSPLSPVHAQLIRIYDAVDYALNAADVPTVGYGGELDKQLVAAQTMYAVGEQLGVPIKLLVGPQTEHKFHPDSQKEFMAFHAAASEQGRPAYPGSRHIRFTTSTVKYHRCEWLTIEEQNQLYAPSTVDANINNDTGVVTISTKNIGVLQIARDVGESVQIDGGNPLPLNAAADGLLPGVYYENQDGRWVVWDYRKSHDYISRPELTKRHNLQGPIDDAFMQGFVCVRGTGTPWSAAQQEWANWTLDRFAREYDKYLRGKLPVVSDREITDDTIETHNLILFGDPGSNAVLAKVVDQLPIGWTQAGLEVRGQQFDPAKYGVPLIFPNPLNPHRYVVVNSGHTFHEAEFKGSNAQLYPRLGDMGVISFRRHADGLFAEIVESTEVFDGRWSFKR